MTTSSFHLRRLLLAQLVLRYDFFRSFCIAFVSLRDRLRSMGSYLLFGLFQLLVPHVCRVLPGLLGILHMVATTTAGCWIVPSNEA